ncbi:hypothetical protein [Providencia manganoxydans]|uniref:hypothetical protein n=1 Tax=Providencia manganoxydans TaxID=2923283 RepID=UPI0034E39A54
MIAHWHEELTSGIQRKSNIEFPNHQEGLKVTEALIRAGGLSGKTIEIIRYSKTSTQVEIRDADGCLVWRDFTFTNDFVFGLAKNIAF